MNAEAWNTRYTSLAPFLADVARSVLDDIALVGLAGSVLRMTQRRDEAARLFAARLVSWHEVTQLLAETMSGCPSIGSQQLLYQFWSGLRLRQAVMDKLMDDKLDLQSPTDWEQRHPGSTALQHVILVATKLERSEALASGRQPPQSAPASSGRTSWRGGRSTPRLNAMGESLVTQVTTSIPTKPPSGVISAAEAKFSVQGDTATFGFEYKHNGGPWMKGTKRLLPSSMAAHTWV
ncbi:hypothetical protein CYMTET_7714 [Cymbomonas tetramitiformis]|uniref:Uncharacterized protein n=1 Tax=Cymbomonas tetramitiformis TaxID=36881 RepID=A0AAE0GV47_9CHLO|nr:hypothetical protein CYMTET_7714 [Cymbomonas tetramitiformis]